MNFRPALWHPIAIGLSVLNVAGFGQAIGVAEPMHAAVHAGLAAAFAIWALRLRQGPRRLEGESALQADFESLADEVGSLRQELSETQDRLDFTERLLAQEREARRVGPER